MQRFTVTACDVELAIRQGVGDPLAQECGVVSFAPPVVHILIRPHCQDLRPQQFEIYGQLLPAGPMEKRPLPAAGALALEDVMRAMARRAEHESRLARLLCAAEAEVARLREENRGLLAQLLTGDPGTPVATPEPIIVGPADPPVATRIKNNWESWGGVGDDQPGAEEVIPRSYNNPTLFPPDETPMGCPPPAKEGEE